jgi:hypothetical protein
LTGAAGSSASGPAAIAGRRGRPRRPVAPGISICSHPWVDALKTQQAAERLRAGRGAPEPGQDYVFTGPEGGLLNVNALRDRVGIRHSPRRACGAASCTRPGTPSLRTRWPLGRPVLGGGDAGAHEPRDALQRVCPVHPESHAPRRQYTVSRMTGAGRRGDGRACGRGRTPEILPLRMSASG